jgi:pentatricopeptide repeat protein
MWRVAACAHCGAGLPDGARFCPQCGSAATPNCSSCGADRLEGASFCPTCGSRYEEQATATPAAPPIEDSLNQRKVVTILFADLTESTPLVESLDPEHMRGIVGRFFDAMREAIVAEGGRVEKFIGDAVMAVFGVPSVHEDDPARAIQAALAMRRRLQDLNKELSNEFGLHLQMRIGISTGPVVATTDPAQDQVMVTGEAVNVAARLQSMTEPGTILVAERTASSARTFEFVDRGSLLLKGKAQPVRAFLVEGEANIPARGVPWLRAPIVGRDNELDVLTSIYERVASEHNIHLVTVYGDAGVGKSRLTREFLGRLGQRDEQPYVLRGRCLPYGTSVTYWPLAEILKSAAGVLDSDPPQIVLTRIHSLVDSLLVGQPESIDATVDALAHTLGLAGEHGTLDGADPRTVRARLHQAWRTFFSATAVEGPVVVIIEDIHWAEEALLDLIEEVIDRAQGSLLFVCPSRPDLTTTRPTWGGGRRNAFAVSLDPLSATDSETLVRHLLAVDDLPNPVRDRIMERAEGNPFFLEEILRRLIEEGLIVRVEDRWRALPSIVNVEIPDNVQGVLAARIDLLEPEHKRVLQLASVVGRTFWPEPVAQLMGIQDARQLDASLQRLEELDLITSRFGSSLSGQTEYLFKHILTRDVAYEGLPIRDRSVAHARVGTWLELSSGERAPEFAELLAHHYSTAIELGQVARLDVPEDLRRNAFTWLLRASRQARDRYVLQQSIKLSQRALDVASGPFEEVHALEELGEAYANDSLGDLTFATFLRASEIAIATEGFADDRRASLIAQAVEVPVRWPGMMTFFMPPEEVSELIKRGLSYAGNGDNPARSRLLGLEAGMAFISTDIPDDLLAEYISKAEESVEIALRLDLPLLASQNLDQLQATVIYPGRYAAGIGPWLRRWALRDRLNDSLELGDAIAMGAWMYSELDQYEKAIEIGRTETWASGHMSVAGHARAHVIRALCKLGRWDEALSEFEQMQEVYNDGRSQPPGYALRAYAAIAEILLFRGKVAESDDIATPVLAQSGGTGFALHSGIYLARGEYGQALAAIPVSDRNAEWSKNVILPTRCELALATAPTDCFAIADETKAYGEQGEFPSLPAFADELRGWTKVRSADLPTGIVDLQAAVARFDQLGARWHGARARRLLAAALAAMGDSTATEVQAHADATYTELRVVRDPVIESALVQI